MNVKHLKKTHSPGECHDVQGLEVTGRGERNNGGYSTENSDALK